MPCETQLQDCNDATFQLEVEYLKFGMTLSVVLSCNWQHCGQVSYSMPLS
jgi:hypothetical protein